MRFNKDNRTALLIISVLLVALVALNAASSSVRTAVYAVASPVQDVTWEAGQGLARTTFGERDVSAELNETKEENLVLRQRIAELQQINRENETLQEALDLQASREMELSGMRVIGRSIGEDILLARVSDDVRIKDDTPVISSSRVAVGTVTEQNGNVVRIRLLSHPDSSVSVRVSGRDAEGVVRGEERSSIYLDLVPHDKDIQKRDVVTTSNIGEVFPDNMLVGYIEEIDRSDVTAFQKAELNPFVVFSELDHVFAITNHPGL